MSAILHQMLMTAYPSGTPAGDPHYSNVSLLLHMDGTNGSTTFTDNSPTPKTAGVAGNAQISTAQSVFGGASGLFDGAGDYLFFGNQAEFAFGTGDFTIEFFVRFAASGVVYTLFDWRPTSTNGAYPLLNRLSDNTLGYYVSSAYRITSGAVSAGVWMHVAICRASGSTRMFIDGTQAGSTWADSTNYIVGTNRPVIGAQGFTGGATGLNGNFDELRITKGVGRYTANFTPPAAAFPNF